MIYMGRIPPPGQQVVDFPARGRIDVCEEGGRAVQLLGNRQAVIEQYPVGVYGRDAFAR